MEKKNLFQYLNKLKHLIVLKLCIGKALNAILISDFVESQTISLWSDPRTNRPCVDFNVWDNLHYMLPQCTMFMVKCIGLITCRWKLGI